MYNQWVTFWSLFGTLLIALLFVAAFPVMLLLWAGSVAFTLTRNFVRNNGGTEHA